MNFDVHCHHCDQRYLLQSSALGSIHNTSDGPIAYATCPKGHRLVRRFRAAGDVRTATLMR
ncbi:MAG: hypothetical protein AAGA90_20290 [Actinomycetota bacterium]